MSAHAQESVAPSVATKAASQPVERRVNTTPNLAFYYGASPPISILQAFDAVVLDPTKSFDPTAHPLAHTVWLARTFGDAPIGAKPAAGAVDASHIDAFFQQQIAARWQQGYRGFLLDSPLALAALDRIRSAYPDAKLIVGGEDALQHAAPYAASLYAVVSPPLKQGLNADHQVAQVPAALQTSRLAAALAFHRQTGVPVVSIEYCGEFDRECARQVAAQVIAEGIVPYVTSARQDVVGIGKLEVLPRKILIVQDSANNAALDMSQGVHSLSTPLNYLGYSIEYADVNALPSGITPDRYAGVVAWLQDDNIADPEIWERWLAERVAEHIPVAFMERFGFDPADGPVSGLNLQTVPDRLSTPITVVHRDPMIGFEFTPPLKLSELPHIRSGPGSQPLMTLSANGAVVDPVALTSWGGYALNPYTVMWLSGLNQSRWAIQPIDFLKAALRLPAMPSPSVTTENGLRLMMTHVDGDGFASRAEFPGADFAGEALYNTIFSRYPIPMTLSVIEGEVGPTGMFPALSPRLEQLAKQMFLLPNVEIGSHTYSHPFHWENVDPNTGRLTPAGLQDKSFALKVPNYSFDLDREISGSIDYINSRLAPAGKKTEVLQWSGNCRVPAVAVRKAYAAGVYNVNGGETMITESARTWTSIGPIGINRGPGAFQIFAPNQDENIYTNDWQGPFYGFSRVLETFAMTDEPLRFKPIDIYYHMYSGTKLASLRALTEIFDAVLKQPILPVYLSEYAGKVLDWRTFAVAREIGANGRWQVRGNGTVRELHWPGASGPELAGASQVSGYAKGPDGTYIHIAGGNASFTLPSVNAPAVANNTLPYIVQASGFVQNFSRTAQGMQFEFAGHYKPYMTLANAQSCRITVNDRPVQTRREGALVRFDTEASPALNMTYQKINISCGG